MSTAYPGINANDIILNGSKTLALTLYNDLKTEISISNASSPFQFTIPVDQDLTSFTQNSLKQNSNNVLTLDGFNVTKNNVSIFYHIKPSNKLLGYFVSLRFGAYTVLNSTAKLYDVSSIFCPNNLRTENNESFYVLFANISHTINYKGFVGAGYKELNTTEFQYFCTQQGSNLTFLGMSQRYLTANISVRVQLAGI